MKFEPKSFYFGVVDFFSIMLPGAVLALFLYPILGPHLFGSVLPAIKGDADGWVIFLFAAYLLGHFVFLLGSYLDEIYDPVRKLIWSGAKDLAYPQASAIKRKRLGKQQDKAINTFQWSKAMLVLQHPEGIVEVGRLEADSKFFRSLVVVLAFLLVIAIARGRRDYLVLVLFVLVLLSFWRYVERRYKSTQHAYWYMIALDAMSKGRGRRTGK